MLKKCFNIFKLTFFLSIFLIDLFIFKLFKKKIREDSFKMFHILFFKTKGFSNKILHKFFRSKKLSISSTESDLIFKKLIFNSANHKELKNNGFSLHENIVPKIITDKIIDSAKMCYGLYATDEYKSDFKERLDQDNLKAKKFAVGSNELIDIPEVQDIVTDQKILNIAQNYLGSAPILDIISVAFSFPNHKNDSNAAQMWHIDLDRPKWIKFFLFLSDCESDNGPHKFIKSTHLSEKLPKEILTKGYKRIDDSIIQKYFNDKEIKNFIGPAGTILIEDSVGLHRGSQVKNGRRVMMQVQFSSSLFGAEKDTILFPEKMTENFEKTFKNHPKIFENFSK